MSCSPGGLPGCSVRKGVGWKSLLSLRSSQLLEALKTLPEEDQLKQQQKTLIKPFGVILRPKGKYLDGKKRGQLWKLDPPPSLAVCSPSHPPTTLSPPSSAALGPPWPPPPSSVRQMNCPACAAPEAEPLRNRAVFVSTVC